MNALVWDDSSEKGETFEVAEIPADLADQAAEYRDKLLETVASHDDHIMEKYLGEETISVEELQEGIRAGTVAAHYTPVLCGSAFKNKGVQPMLDAVVSYLPSPLEVPPAVGHDVKDPDTPLERKVSDDEPFAALAFKIMTDQHMGKLTYARVYSGTIAKGAAILNTTKGKKERIGRILQMHANHKEDHDVAVTGDIVGAHRPEGHPHR